MEEKEIVSKMGLWVFDKDLNPNSIIVPVKVTEKKTVENDGNLSNKLKG